MRMLVRPLFALVVALASICGVSASWVMATAVPLLAAHTTALIMGGTFHPLMGPHDSPAFVTDYLDNAVNAHLEPAFGAPVDNAVAVFTPEEFFPIGPRTFDRSVADGRAGLHTCITAPGDCVYNQDSEVTPAAGSAAPQPGDVLQVFSYSQSAVIASLEKRDLIDAYRAGDPAISFMLVANPMRPNGGVLMRLKGWPTIPILGISFPGASPTNSAELEDGSYAYPTVDIVRQYDALGGDFPVRPLNLIALVNALMGYGLLHGETVDVPFGQARYQGREGDTTYYVIETDIVPLLQPLVPFIPKPILKAIDAPLRVIIEDAYNRDIAPGTPTPMRWWPVGDLFRLAVNLVSSIPVAVDNLLEGFGLPRVMRTQAPGLFGVGGLDLPPDPVASATTARHTETVAPESDQDRSNAGGDDEPVESGPVEESGAEDDDPPTVDPGPVTDEADLGEDGAQQGEAEPAETPEEPSEEQAEGETEPEPQAAPAEPDTDDTEPAEADDDAA